MDAVPMVSVVMGVFNNEDTLSAALDSVLSQEGVDLEFIVIDDGSTDGSAGILDRAALKDTRLKVIHKKNEGLTRALIDGCERAAAPWIARQDADDLSLPGRLAALLALAAQHPTAVLLATSAWCLGPRGERLRQAVCSADPALARRQLLDLDLNIGPPAHGSTMFLREAYRAAGGYRPCFYYGQDSDLWMRLAEQGGVVYAAELLYSYQFSAASISGGQRHVQKTFGRLGRQCRMARRSGRSEAPFLKQAQQLTDQLIHGGRKSSKRGLAMGHYHIGCLLEKSDPEAAAGYFRQAIACNPWALRSRLKLWRGQWSRSP